MSRRPAPPPTEPRHGRTLLTQYASADELRQYLDAKAQHETKARRRGVLPKLPRRRAGRKRTRDVAAVRARIAEHQAQAANDSWLPRTLTTRQALAELIVLAVAVKNEHAFAVWREHFDDARFADPTARYQPDERSHKRAFMRATTLCDVTKRLFDTWLHLLRYDINGRSPGRRARP